MSTFIDLFSWYLLDSSGNPYTKTNSRNPNLEEKTSYLILKSKGIWKTKDMRVLNVGFNILAIIIKIAHRSILSIFMVNYNGINGLVIINQFMFPVCCKLQTINELSERYIDVNVPVVTRRSQYFKFTWTPCAVPSVFKTRSWRNEVKNIDIAKNC